MDLAKDQVAARQSGGSAPVDGNGRAPGLSPRSPASKRSILGSLRGNRRYDALMAEVHANIDCMRARVEREGW